MRERDRQRKKEKKKERKKERQRERERERAVETNRQKEGIRMKLTERQSVRISGILFSINGHEIFL